MADKQPGNLIVANNLASLLLDRRTDKASLKKAQSLAAVLRKSQIPQFKDTLGWLSYLQGDYRTAVSLSEEAAAALPDQASVRYHLGMSYISTNQLEKASECLVVRHRAEVCVASGLVHRPIGGGEASADSLRDALDRARHRHRCERQGRRQERDVERRFGHGGDGPVDESGHLAVVDEQVATPGVSVTQHQR